MPTDAEHAVPSGYSERPTSRRGSAFRLAWSHFIPADRTSGTLVLPDGAVDIVWADGELTVAGPDRTTHRERTTPGSTVAGLRFARGAASAWLGVEMRELVGLRVPLRDIVGRRRAENLAGPLCVIADPDLLPAALERAFAGDADPAGARFATAVIDAVGAAATEEAIIPAVRRATGLAERTLRRRCDEVFGYGPRTLSRVLRLQRLLALLEAEPKLPLAAAAAASGFADQPHMSREIRALTTLSPAAGKAACGPALFVQPLPMAYSINSAACERDQLYKSQQPYARKGPIFGHSQPVFGSSTPAFRSCWPRKRCRAIAPARCPASSPEKRFDIGGTEALLRSSLRVCRWKSRTLG